MAGIHHVLQQFYYGQLDSPTTIQLQFVIQSKGHKCIKLSGLVFHFAWATGGCRCFCSKKQWLT